MTIDANGKLIATFNRPMFAATINPTTFTLFAGTSQVQGTVTYDGTVAKFAPNTPLATGTTFTATITTGAKDVTGFSLDNNYVSTFTTGATLDGPPPTINPVSPSPSPGSSVSPGGPTVTVVTPLDGATGVSINQTIGATFSKPMDPTTITATTVTLTRGTTLVPGSVSYSGNTEAFVPTSSLTANTTYTGTITTGVKDAGGTSLATDFVWRFTTGTGTSQAPVSLGATISKYAVIAGSTVTNTGGSNVIGDLGLSPGSAIVGFPPGNVNGTVHIADPDAVQAKSELTNAYNDAVSRSGSPIAVSGNLGGMTLAPGLYTSSTSLAVSSGDLTFDAQGNSNAVFVIQMGSSFTSTAGRQIILAGGAKASNIFWAVGSSATLGTNSVMKGVFLAAESITLQTGASLEGRALTQSGAVSLDSATVTKPAN